MTPNLSFEQAPPISVPYRFFLTAPLFGIAAGLLLMGAGEEILSSRWTPAALAATHLFVAGFMLQAMTGALFQFVPVAAGGNVWRPLLVARLTHPLLTAGAIALAVGFLSWSPGLFRLAATLFLPATILLVAVIGTALLRTPAVGGTLWALRGAVLALAITVPLGIFILETLIGGRATRIIELVNVHAAWGLAGWSLLLLSGVSYFVVPMFQMTPAYPPTFSRWLTPALLVVLAAWSLQAFGIALAWQPSVWFAGALLAASWAALTLRLQLKRRRRVPDPTLQFFRIAMLCVLAIPLSEFLATLAPDLVAPSRRTYWLAVLALPGIFVSAICGMLYKIAPFINWLHLQRHLGPGSLPPNMKDMIPEQLIRVQMWLHFSALATLLGATFWSPLVAAGGLLFALSSALLAWNLACSARVYRRHRHGR